MTTWVKVCGLTRREDVDGAVAAGADAVGFIIASQSPRQVDVAQARKLAHGVNAQAVLVSVDLTPEDVLATAKAAGISGVQPHGRHAAAAAEAATAAGLFVLYPIPVADPFVAPPVPSGATPLFDTADVDRHGGTGRTFRWDLVAGYPGDFVVAGGLGPGNVADAVRATGAFGVDASSRLEAAVGIKDAGKVTAFVQEAKRA
ncbi:MAG: phosphoribosylanthranilate isomerase [Acidimicrobiia bacterium]|nr:phosphoribosylanthranilate isomerase [Acidimicrobiia bacterium]